MGVAPKISIVVPVYKVERYLNQCVESLIHQTFSNIEIVLVDDGSPDRCPQLCDEWSTRDARVRVIHKKNGGLSDARNAGIDAGIGEYILFVDSDDFVKENMCEKLLETAEDTQSDMVICGFMWKYPDHEVRQPMTSGNAVRSFSNMEMLNVFFQNKTVELSVAWNKLYRRKLFDTSDHIRYPVGKLHEDEFTTYRLIYAANRITVVPDPLYYYVQRNAGIMSAFSQKNLIDSIEAAESYIPWNKKHHLSLEKEIACAYDILSYSFYLRYWQDNRIDPQRRLLNRFRRFVIENTPAVYWLSDISPKYRIWDFLFRTNTSFLFRWVFTLKKIMQQVMRGIDHHVAE